jgi:hypothetical protein
MPLDPDHTLQLMQQCEKNIIWRRISLFDAQFRVGKRFPGCSSFKIGSYHTDSTLPTSSAVDLVYSHCITKIFVSKVKEIINANFSHILVHIHWRFEQLRRHPFTETEARVYTSRLHISGDHQQEEVLARAWRENPPTRDHQLCRFC